MATIHRETGLVTILCSLSLVGCSASSTRSAALYKPADPQDRMVCRSEIPTGSKIAETRCLSVREIEKERTDAKAVLNRTARRHR